MASITGGDIFLCLLALLFPPLAVWVKRGLCSADSVINLLLCVLGYFPGLFHAWYIIMKFPEPELPYSIVPEDAEAIVRNGNVAYIIVQQPAKSPKAQSNVNYGATNSAASGSRVSPAPAIASSSSAPAPPQAHNDAGEGGSSGGPPPSYAQAVADHKIQTQD